MSWPPICSISVRLDVSWGWRLPFLLGALVAFAGIVIRQGIGAEVIEPQVQAPVRETFGRYRLQVLRVMALNIASSVGYYAAFVYAVSYLEDIDKLSDATALSLNTGVLGVLLLLFTIGLKLKVKNLLKPEIWLGSSLHMLITTIVFGFLIFGLSLAGFSKFTSLSIETCFLIAFALSFSSTIFAVKILEAFLKKIAKM